MPSQLLSKLDPTGRPPLPSHTHAPLVPPHRPFLRLNTCSLRFPPFSFPSLLFLSHPFPLSPGILPTDTVCRSVYMRPAGAAAGAAAGGRGGAEQLRQRSRQCNWGRRNARRAPGPGRSCPAAPLPTPLRQRAGGVRLHAPAACPSGLPRANYCEAPFVPGAARQIRIQKDSPTRGMTHHTSVRFTSRPRRLCPGSMNAYFVLWLDSLNTALSYGIWL